MDSFAVRALHPRPEGRGFPRKMDKHNTYRVVHSAFLTKELDLANHQYVLRNSCGDHVRGQ